MVKISITEFLKKSGKYLEIARKETVVITSRHTEYELKLKDK